VRYKHPSGKVYQALPHQNEFHHSAARYRLLLGGVRSGKTLPATIEAHIQAGMRKSTGWIVSPSYPMLMTPGGPYDTFWEWAPQGLKYNKTDKIVRYPNGSRVQFKFGNEPDRLRGAELDWVYVDEAAYVPEKSWSIIQQRLVRDGIGWLATSPKGANWIKLKLFDRNGERGPNGELLIQCWRFSTHANTHLTHEQVSALEGELSQAFRDQDIYAKFVTFAGLIYDEFREATHVDDAPDAFSRVVAGVDWGLVNPAAIVVLGETGTGRLWAIDEHYKAGSSPDDMVRAAKALAQRRTVTCFYADPSEPDYINAFQRAGMRCTRAVNDVLPGIREVQKRLKPLADGKPGLMLGRGRVPNLLREIQGYEWHEAKDGVPAKEEPAKQHDHAMDAARYCIMGLARSSAKPAQIRGI